MNTSYLYLFLATLLTSCSSLSTHTPYQNEESDITIFNKGVTIFDMINELSINWELKRLDTLKPKEKIKYDILINEKEEILELALVQFEKIIDLYPNSKLYPKTLYNLARINALLDYEEDEIKYLEMIITSNANDKENSGRSGLMANPYANFKNHASKRLTEIYIKKGDYNKALVYKKINEKYPLQHFCGNAFAADEISNARQYGKIYIGIGEKQKALNYLLPHIFDNGLANNSDLVDLTIELLHNHFDYTTVQQDFERSIASFYAKPDKNGDNETVNYYMNYYNTEIEVPSWTLGFETDAEKVKFELKKIIRESEFYQKLQKVRTDNNL